MSHVKGYSFAKSVRDGGTKAGCVHLACRKSASAIGTLFEGSAVALNIGAKTTT